MAIDTAQKRFSMMDFDLPVQPGMDPPDSAVDAASRSTLLWLYSGITLGGGAAAGDDWIIRVRRRRR